MVAQQTLLLMDTAASDDKCNGRRRADAMEITTGRLNLVGGCRADLCEELLLQLMGMQE